MGNIQQKYPILWQYWSIFDMFCPRFVCFLAFLSHFAIGQWITTQPVCRARGLFEHWTVQWEVLIKARFKG